MRRLGVKVFYGDAARLELLLAAGAATAKLMIIAIDDDEKSLIIVDIVQKHFPGLQQKRPASPVCRNRMSSFF